MTGRPTRRGFLLRAAAGAAAIALGVTGLARRGARTVARAFRIPVKPLDPARLRDPHDLAG